MDKEFHNENYDVAIRQLDRNEKIPPGAYHSTNGGLTLRPMVRPDETVGQTPADFAADREFFIVEFFIVDLLVRNRTTPSGLSENNDEAIKFLRK